MHPTILARKTLYRRSHGHDCGLPARGHEAGSRRRCRYLYEQVWQTWRMIHVSSGGCADVARHYQLVVFFWFWQPPEASVLSDAGSPPLQTSRPSKRNGAGRLPMPKQPRTHGKLPTALVEGRGRPGCRGLSGALGRGAVIRRLGRGAWEGVVDRGRFPGRES